MAGGKAANSVLQRHELAEHQQEQNVSVVLLEAIVAATQQTQDRVVAVLVVIRVLVVLAAQQEPVQAVQVMVEVVAVLLTQVKVMAVAV